MTGRRHSPRRGLLRHYATWRYGLILAAAIASLVAACGDSPVSLEQQLEELKTAGWEQFLAADYRDAEMTFREARSLGELHDGEALTGQGWSLTYLSSFAGALDALSRVRTADSTWYVDAQAGLAILYDANGQVGRTLDPADRVLTLDSAWVFFYGPRVDWRDIAYIRAKNTLVLSNQIDPGLVETLAALRLIDDEPEIDPADFATWTAGGKAYATAGEAALKRIEAIGIQ